MKIIKLQSANFKRLKAIEIVPHGNTVVVSGKNGQGKSSILDSIFVALAGKDKDLLKPIREGEVKAEIKVETEDYYINRTFKQGRTELEVISKDGEIMSKPQTFLDGLVGKLSFDPLEFAQLKSAEQRSLLLQLTGVNLNELDQRRKNSYEVRHEVGVLLKQYAERDWGLVSMAEEKVKEGKKDIKALRDKAWDLRSEKDKWVIAQEKIKTKLARVQEISKLISVLEEEETATLTEVNILSLLQQPLGELEEFDTAIELSDAHNCAVDAAVLILEENTKRMKLQSEYDQQTAKIESIDTEKATVLENAKFPIQGLSVTEDAVVFNKIPFQQLSSAEKLKVSMAIAMAMNPELRVIRIMDGSLLDEDNMKVIAEMAVDKDYQVWVEKVDSSGKVGFYIEDGEVVTNNS